jgi:SpoVK/Ycf46/Vps4 family AAA+-type ATPase
MLALCARVSGKTTMANVVAKIMLKMKLMQTDKVVFVNNPLELLAGYVGQTPAKVDAKVEEARGGCLFIDEAYSILKDGSNAGGSGKESSSSGSFAREAIDTIMKHLDPPSCTFIFAGYEKPMSEFLKMNEGLSRRIPYRFHFEPYTVQQLAAIFRVMCDAKGEMLAEGVAEKIEKMLQSLPEQQLLQQNAGLVSNWLSFAQMERDDRVDVDDATRNPDLASTLEAQDLEKALDNVRNAA